MTLLARIYTEKEIEKARQRAKVVGWVQGGGAVILGGMVLRLLGWIPAVAIIGLVVFVLYKLLSGSDDPPAEG